MNLSVVYVPVALSLGTLGVSHAQVAGVPTLPRFFFLSDVAIAFDGGVVGGNGPASGVLALAATTHVGLTSLSAAGSMVLPKEGRSFLSYGASADVYQWLHLGVARWDSAGTAYLHVPLGLTLPLAWCMKSQRAWLLWADGRRDFRRVAPRSQSAYWNDVWAYAFGLTLETSTRLGFQFAWDHRTNHDWSLSAGVHLSLKTVSKEARTRFFNTTDLHSCSSLPAEIAGH